jgi:hypothetical protein
LRLSSALIAQPGVQNRERKSRSSRDLPRALHAIRSHSSPVNVTACENQRSVCSCIKRERSARSPPHFSALLLIARYRSLLSTQERERVTLVLSLARLLISKITVATGERSRVALGRLARVSALSSFPVANSVLVASSCMLVLVGESGGDFYAANSLAASRVSMTRHDDDVPTFHSISFYLISHTRSWRFERIHRAERREREHRTLKSRSWNPFYPWNGKGFAVRDENARSGYLICAQQMTLRMASHKSFKFAIVK